MNDREKTLLIWWLFALLIFNVLFNVLNNNSNKKDLIKQIDKMEYEIIQELRKNGNLKETKESDAIIQTGQDAKAVSDNRPLKKSIERI